MSGHDWSPSPEALAYLREHAIEPHVAAALGVTETGGALAFPCRDGDGRPTVRRRVLNGSGPKVLGESGRPLGVTYWRPRQRPERAERLLVCEAEGDALAAVSAIEAGGDGHGARRFLSSAVGAVVSTASTSLPVDRLVAEAQRVGARSVALAFDADDAGRSAAAKVRAALAEVGVRAFSVALPDGADLADLLGRVEQEDRAETLANALFDSEMRPEPPEAKPVAEAPPEGAPELPADRHARRRYDLGELVASADHEPPWRVEPIAADGHLTLLSARGGEGKTWACLAFAGGVAHGATVAGLRCAPGRAVVFDAENGRYVLGSRLGALEPGLPADRVAVYDAEGLRLDDPRDRAWMLEVIRREGASIAFLDSLRALAPDAAENDSDDMAPIVNGAKTLARQSGAAIVLLIHRGHGGADFRGSTAIRDAADLLFVLEREEKDPERRWRRRLRCAKCRIAKEPEERWLGVRSSRGQVTLEEAEPFEPGVSAREPEDVADDLIERVLAAVAEHRPRSHNAVAKLVGARRKNALAALRALEEVGRVRPTALGFEVVPEAPEPPGNHPPAAQGGGGSPAGDGPVGTPPWEPPHADGSDEREPADRQREEGHNGDAVHLDAGGER